jgi:hypothetical protein
MTRYYYTIKIFEEQYLYSRKNFYILPVVPITYCNGKVGIQPTQNLFYLAVGWKLIH